MIVVCIFKCLLNSLDYIRMPLHIRNRLKMWRFLICARLLLLLAFTYLFYKECKILLKEFQKDYKQQIQQDKNLNDSLFNLVVFKIFVMAFYFMMISFGILYLLMDFYLKFCVLCLLLFCSIEPIVLLGYWLSDLWNLLRTYLGGR